MTACNGNERMVASSAAQRSAAGDPDVGLTPTTTPVLTGSIPRPQ
jgi:hypothetical protein